MQLDWFTIAAQIVNFLVLVYLLKRFLYGPIVNAMDRREKRVTDRLRDAEEREAAADLRASHFERKSKGLDQRRDQLIEQAGEEAAQHRTQLIEAARREVAEAGQRWREELEREQESLLDGLRSQVAIGVAAAARRALQDLASVDLEQRIVSVFHDRLGKLDAAERLRLADAIQGSDATGEPMSVVTAFELSKDQRDALRQALEEQLGQPVELGFSVSAELISGIELRTPDSVLAWSLDAFLGDLEEEIGAVLRQARSRDDESNAAPPRKGGVEQKRVDMRDEPKSEPETEP
jgi:F-type H+-transporting ATPase subunit b